MATIINNPQPVETTKSSGNGFLIGVIILVIFVLILLYYGLPYLRSGFGAPQVNVPDHVNVNVHSSK